MKKPLNFSLAGLVLVLVGSQAQGEATLENKALRIVALPGQPGVAVYLKSDAAGKRMELAILAPGTVQSALIDKAEVVKSASGRSVLRVRAGTADAEFSLGSSGFVKINPGKNAASVEVRTGAGTPFCPISSPTTWSSTRSTSPGQRSPCQRKTSSCSSSKAATPS